MRNLRFQRRLSRLIGGVLVCASFAHAQGIITTVAGTGSHFGALGDGGPATSANVYLPAGVAVDAAGNLYIAEEFGNRIRKVNAAGTITTVAGNGIIGFSGDGGPATSAEVQGPFGVVVDVAGNVYFSEAYGPRIRKVTPDGIITTVAGNGTNGFSGDGGPATSAKLQHPLGIAVDAAGNLYFADSNNERIRKVTAGGIITTVAGNGVAGFSGDGGPATSASLFQPWGLAVDAAGNLYIGDSNNRRIRKVTAGGIITTVAGNGTVGSRGDGGSATSASLSNPTGVALDAAGNLYIADQGTGLIRKVTPSGTITTVAGGGNNYPNDGGPATSAVVGNANGLAVDAGGNLYIAETEDRVRKVSGQTSGASPQLTQGTAVNGATFQPGMVPGSWALVKGSNLAAVTRIWASADFTSLPNLPTKISGVEVKVNNLPAAVYYISPGQVSFQVPAGVSGTVNVQVVLDGVATNTITGSAVANAPGLFGYTAGGKTYPAAVYLDSVVVGDPALAGNGVRKAKSGDRILLYATGLQSSPAGVVIGSATGVSGVTVNIGTTPATVEFAGLVAVGEYQINIVVPNLADGEYPVVIQFNGQTSQAGVVIPIGQ